MAFRILFSIIAHCDLDIDQIYVNTVFLYEFINQLIYIKIIRGIEIKANKIKLCKLFKTLYSLKQLSKVWPKKLSAFLLERLGLKRTNTDYNIFITKVGLNGLIVSTFVNNIKIIGSKKSNFIEKIKSKLTATFSIVDIGLINLYLVLKMD